MATTTPNYGWDVPTSTDYVKDGATAIETLGDDIDTTLYGLAGANTKLGMQLLSTTALSGATVTISSIPQTFKSLEIWIYQCNNATSSGVLRVAPNGATNICRATGTASIDTNSLRDLNLTYIQHAFGTLRTDSENFARIVISNYSGTAEYKSVTATFGFISSGTYFSSETYSGWLRSTSAISSLVISNSGGSLTAGTAKVFGIS
jgi:hypothetical protein